MGKYLNWLQKNILNEKTDTWNEIKEDKNEQGKIYEAPQEKTLDTIFISHMDDLFWEAGRFIIENNKASIGMLQRNFKIGFNKAARIVEELCEAGIVGTEVGTKPREILINLEEFEELKHNGLIKVSRNREVEKKDEKQETYTIKDIERMSRTLLRINADYSNDGENLKGFKNFIIPSTSSENQTQIINALLEHNSPATMKLILMDDSVINYNSYNPMPHMLIPVITNEEKFDAVMNWCYSEMQGRINKFMEHGAKSIDSFNQKAVDLGIYAMPRILCIANEANSFFKYVKISLEKLFLNSNVAGIYFILFSRFSLKKLSLGRIEELLQPITADKLCILLSKDKNTYNIRTDANNFDSMEGHQFERFCANILVKNGFENVEVTQGSGDHGIDILAGKDDITYAVQCKCYSSDIGNAAVQQAYTGKGFYNKDIAVVLTNRYFTQQATEEAKQLGVKLWNRDKLKEMIGINEGKDTEKTYYINEDFVTCSLKNGNKIEILSICHSDINAANIFLSFSVKLKEEYSNKFDFSVAVEFDGKTALSSNENGVEFFGGKEENGEIVAGIPKWMDIARDKLLNGDKMKFLKGVEEINEILDEFMSEMI